ncbi:MAG: universal stress protein [Anaerolineales bacterium]
MKVLIPTDGTNAAVPAIMQAGFAARTLGAKLTLLAVVRSKNRLPESQAILEHAQRILREINVEAETRTRLGHPLTELLAEVAESAYDLVVMGGLRVLSWPERFAGDAARSMLSAMPTAVLFAKGVSDDFDRILLCDSLGLDGTLIRVLNKRFPQFFKGKRQITILHVMSQIGAQPGVKSWELRASAEELIGAGTIEGQRIQEELSALTARFRSQVKPKIRHGVVVEEIMAEADEGGYDLIVVGAHHGAGWQRLLLENLASLIIASSRKPVLVLPGSQPAEHL